MEKRDTKRFIIVFIYFLILCIFLLGVYFWLKPTETCFDQRKNQNEQEVDCGGICQKKCNLLPQFDLTVGEKGYVESGISGKYDLYGKIFNPNNAFGSGEFNYEFNLKDASGVSLGKFSGKSFILPGEEKYLVATNIPTEAIPSQLELALSDVKWEEFVNYETPQLKIINRNYKPITGGVGFSEAYGLLKNESPFDFSTIKVNIILKDSSGKVIALNTTALNTVKTGENRDFKAIWPNKFSGEVGNMEFQTEVNVFNSESFAKRYFRSQKFQEYDY